jgi:hypothetical protein
MAACPRCPSCKKEAQYLQRTTIISTDETIILSCPHDDCRVIISAQVQPLSSGGFRPASTPTVDNMDIELSRAGG